MSKRIAMFGGSFNPVHNAHTEFAKKVIEEADIDLLYIIPTFSSPHKTDINMATAEDRYKMCEIAFKDIKNTVVSDIEIKRKGKSYTCDTLQQLKNLHPSDQLILVVGADMFVTLESWRNPQKIFKLARIVTFPRDNESYPVLQKYAKKYNKIGAKTDVLNEPVLLLSSTDIRKNIKNEDFLKSHLNSNVYDYIVNNKLYGA